MSLLLSRLPIALAALLVVSNVRCQLLSPQSHLGRLVQSITSPLIISSSGSAGGDQTGASPFAPVAASSASYDQDDPDAAALQFPTMSSEAKPPRLQHHQQEFRQQEDLRGAYAAAALQQAPSRGVPQRYREIEEGAPSNRRPAEESYQMGAYLGPTIDDKEIQGAFNSNNDERDEDDGPAGYEGPPSGEGGSAKLAAASYGAARPSYGNRESSMGPASYNGGENKEVSYNNDDDDSSNADEDDLPPRRGNNAGYRRPSGALNQAASQQFEGRRQRSNSGRRQQYQQQLVAAANGYAPYGQPAMNGGPIDLSGLVAAAGGAGYDVYNGDGSYPGPGYWQQQQPQQPRQRASSNPYNQQQQWGDNQQHGPNNGNSDRQSASNQSDPDDDGDDDMA